MENFNIIKNIERQNRIDQGYFDGRYKNKIIPNKKKKINKLWARMKKVV